MRIFYPCFNAGLFTRRICNVVFVMVSLIVAFSAAVMGQAPNISYATPQTYTAGTTITTLTPTSSGVAAPAYASSAVNLGSGFSNPFSSAVDAAGNVYVADKANNSIKKIPVGGGTPISIGTGFSGPAGVAVDAAGNVYVADQGHNLIKKIPIAGGDPITLAVGFGFNNPTGVAVDAAGNVYVADASNGAIEKIPANGSSTFALTSGLSFPYGVAVDGSGNVFIAEGGNSTIDELPFGAISRIILGSGFYSPHGVAVDGDGNVFVADYGNHQVKEILAGTSNTLVVGGTAFAGPTGVTTDGAGNVFVADYTGNTVSQIKPMGGFFVRPFLPGGLTINNTTGAISGTPILGSPATNYTVTAYSATGAGNAATVNITVTSSALLSNLVLSTSTLSPVFSSGTTAYTASTVEAAIQLTPTSPDPNSTIKINGITVASGTVSANIPLIVGSNTISTVVTSSDGSTTKTYTVTVTRLPLTDATLAGLIVTNGTLTPAFASATTSYTTSVGFASVQVTATTNDAHATVKVNGTAVSSGAPTGSIPLTLGANTISVVVVSGDGTVTKTYTITVTRVPSSDATLSWLYLYNAYFSSSFDPGVTTYSSTVSSSTSSIQIDPVTNNANATVKINGITAVSGSYSAGIPLAVGNNVINVVVTAENGTTTKTYTLNIYRTASSDATLSALSLSSGFLSPAFAPATTTYTASVAGNTASITVSPVANFANATISVNGISVTSGAASSPIALNVGSNTISIIVTAENGTTLNAYTVIVTRLGPPPTLSYSGPQTYLAGTAISPLTPTTTGVAVTAYSSTPLTIGTGFNTPYGIATDAAGNVYVADANNNLVKKIPAGGGTSVVIGSGFTTPTGVSVDAAGNVFVADFNSNTVKEILAGTNTTNVFATGFNSPLGVAVDKAGYVYVTDRGNGQVKKIPPGGGAPVLVIGGFNTPEGIGVDAQGNIYVDDAGNNVVKVIPANGGPVTVLASGFSFPAGLAVDGQGNVYVSDYGSGSVKKIVPATAAITTVSTGYVYPYGVAIDATGKIYVSNSNNNIVQLVTPTGGFYISPALPRGLNFDNNTGIISGAPMDSAPAVTYTITAYNAGGGTSATVNIKVNGDPANAILANLAISSGSLTPSFDGTITGYSTAVPNTTTSVTVTPTTGDANATVKVNGTAVVSGSSSQSIALAMGSNIINVVVTSQDGTKTKTYTITVARAFSANADLAGLTLSAGILTPSFNPGSTSYFTSVDNAISSITITPVTADATATVLVNGVVNPSGVASAAIPLAVGNNVINVVVTAQDGVTVKTYTISVNRSGPMITVGAVSGSISACAGTASVNPNIEQFTVSATNLTDNITATAPAGFEVSLAAASGYGSTVTLIQSLGAVNNVPVYVRSSASNAAGYLSGNVLLSSTGFITQNVAVSGVINALLTVNPVPNILVAPGVATPAINFTGTATGFSWVNNAPGIGLPASGTGNIPSFNAVNTSGSPVTATVAVTPLSLGYAYATVSYTNQLKVINTTTNLVEAAINVGHGPFAVIASPDRSRVYVGNDLDGTVSVIDTKTNTVTNTITVGGQIGSLCLSPDGTRLYASGNSTTVSVVNTTTNTIMATIPVSSGGVGMVVSPDGTRLYVATGGASLAVVNTATNVVISDTALGINLFYVLISPDGTKLFASTLSGIVVINTSTNNVIATIPFSTHPVSFSLTPDGSHLYVVGGNSLSVINTATNAVSSLITPLENEAATHAAVSPDGSRLYVSNLTGGSITVISTATNNVILTTPEILESPGSITVTGGSGCPGAPVTFTITVNPPSNNANLSALVPSGGILSPVFAPATTSYTALVGNTTSSVKITPTTSDAGAMVIVNGTAVTSGSASASIPLVVGANVITTVVTAQDGVTKKTYTLTITRASALITASAVTGSITACQGSPSASPDIQQFAVTGSTLTANITATAPAGFEVSLSSGSGYGNSISIAQTGGAVSGGVVYVRSAASATGNISGNVVLTTTGAVSYKAAVSGVINAIPTVNNVANQTVANGATTFPVTFTGTAATYSWVNDNPGVGLVTYGSGDIASFNASNSTGSSVTAHLTVTPMPVTYAFIASWGNPGALNVINTSTNSVVASITLPGEEGVAVVSLDGKFVYVASQLQNKVSVINTTSHIIIASIAVGSSPTGMALSPDGSKVYVASQSGSVSVIGTTTNTLISTLTGAGISSPNSILVSPDGSKLFLLNIANQTVSVLDATTQAVIARMNVGANAKDMVLSPDGSRLYVGNDGSNSISVLNTVTNTTMPFISCLGPMGLALNPDGSRLYVSNHASNTLSVINTTSNAIIATVPVGSLPLGVSVTPDGSRIYVANQGSSNVTVVDAVTYLPITSITVASTPYGYGKSIFSRPGCPGVPVTFNITVTPSAPTISYAGPQVYTEDLAITALAPTSVGINPAAYKSTTTAMGSGFNTPFGVAMDAAGNIYIADEGNNAIKKIPVGGGAVTTLGSGFSAPSGVAVDAAGNIYVADQGNNVVKKIPAGSNTPVGIGSGFSAPTGVAVDASGNVYVADAGNNAIKEILTAGGSIVTLGSGFSGPTGVAIDPFGNIYVADAGNFAIKKIAAGSNTPVSVGSGFNNPTGIAVDAMGDLFVADQFNSAVKMIPVGGGAPLAIGGGFNFPSGVAVDGVGDVIVADQQNNAIKKITPSGGYYLSSALPAGLSFDWATGIISGIATVVSPATNYTVTAYSATTSASAVVNITVKAVPLPVVTYSGPQTYTSGVTISPLTPASSGVAAPAYGPAITIGSGFSQPSGVAVTPSGDVLVGDVGSLSLKKIPAGSNTPRVFLNNINGVALAVDNTGNIFIGDGQGTVAKYSATGQQLYTLGSNQAINPIGVSVDVYGNAFMPNRTGGTIMEVKAGAIPAYTVATGFTNPAAAVADPAGNLYVADTHTTITKIPADGSVRVNLGAGLNTPFGISLSSSGNIYVSDRLNNAVKQISLNSSSTITLGSSFSDPRGIATDGAGNVYVADYGNNAVKEIKPKGGYYISPALPAGLSFDASTGIISGTPTKLSPATIYTITAYNSIGLSASVTLNLAVNVVPPVIAYGSPHSYTTGNAIVPLTPTSTGVAAYGYGGSVVYTPNFGFPGAIAIDAAGNCYVVDKTHLKIMRIPAGGGTPVAIGPLLTGGANGVAVDATGNVYVAEPSLTTVIEIPANGGTTIALGSGINNPSSVAVDAAGNVYVSETYNNNIKKISAGSGTTTIVASGITITGGLAVDPAGNLYFSDYVNNSIKKIPAAGGSPTVVATGLSYPLNIAVDAIGNIFVLGDETSTVGITEIFAGTNTPVVIDTQIALPVGIAVDGAGNMFITDQVSKTIQKYTPTGGYFLNKALPAGLNFSNTNGIISGTPVVNTPATNYTVTAYNTGGSSSSMFSIAVTPNANLASLGISSGTLSPAFAGTTTNYTDAVINLISSVQLTPVAVDPSATIKVNGIAVAQGAASQVIPLIVGSNAIAVAVTAADGTTIKTYTITVTRALPNNANLTNLSLNSGTLNPVFASGTTAYTALVSNATASLTLTPTVSDIHASVKVNGVSVASGSASASIPLIVGVNNITTIVTAQDGSTTKTYTVAVTRPSNNAYLTNLTLSSGTLSPAFAMATSGYSATVSGATTSVTVTPTVNNPNSTVTVNGVVVASGAASAAIPLVVGTNTITTVVTAQDGVTHKTYTITVTRATSANADLANLTLSSGSLSPAFSPGTTNYTALVSNTTNYVTVTPVTSDINSKVTVNGVVVTSGLASSGIPLMVGTNIITTIVTAQDGTNLKTYSVTITRAAPALSSNANLFSLATSTGTLTPGFASNNFFYNVMVSNSVASTTVTPVTADLNATVTVNGNQTVSGTASAPVNLNIGANVITIVVTAQDGSTTTTYAITVIRPPSNNPYLSNLVLSSGTLSPAFALTAGNYTATVSSATVSVSVTPTTNNINATVTVNGTAVMSGNASGAIPLVVGTNVITTVVTAQDGVTHKTYTITVTRPSNNAYLSKLVLSSGTLSPAFAVATGSYTASVSNATTSVTVTPTLNNLNSSVKVNGVAVASGAASAAIPLTVGANTITAVITAQDGVTHKTYTIIVTRASGALNSIYLPGNGEQTAMVTSLNEKVEANNILSPNGDGINDIWVVKNIAFYPNNTVAVYNKAGQVVFTKKGYTNDWDGTYRGSVLSEGTYYYSVDLGNGDHIKGFITVVNH